MLGCVAVKQMQEGSDSRKLSREAFERAQTPMAI
jgi:hypothetical protein